MNGQELLEFHRDAVRNAGRNPDDILASFRNKVFAETGKDMGDGS